MTYITINKKHNDLLAFTLSVEDAKLLVERFDMLDAIMSQRSNKMEVEQAVVLRTPLFPLNDVIASVSSLGHYTIVSPSGSENPDRIVFQNGIDVLKSALAVIASAPCETLEQVSLHHSNMGTDLALVRVRKSEYSWDSIADGGIAWRDENGKIFTDTGENEIGLYKFIVDSKGNAFTLNDAIPVKDNVFAVLHSPSLAHKVGHSWKPGDFETSHAFG